MTTVHIVLGLICAFYFAESNVFVLGKTGSISEKLLNRLSREVGAPPPIDCQLSAWGEWSECEPCAEQKFRSRRIEKFGQFGGRRCLESLGEAKICKPLVPCEKEPIDCGNDFECDSGRCIKKRLACNVDNDCGDFSDEECENPKSPCHGNEGMEVSEIGRTAGNSVNALGLESNNNPFNNEFFNGLCDRVRDGNTRTFFRKPWNLASLAYESKADKTISTEIYKDSIKLITEITKEESHSINAGLSIKTVQTEGNAANISAGAGVNWSRQESLKNIREFSQDKTKQFMKVKGQVQLGTFQIRSRDVMLSDTFLDALTSLPLKYEKGEYFAFLETYGTHYAVSGSVGGKYELVYVLDSLAMETKEVTVKDVTTCLGYNLNIGVGAKDVLADAKLDGKHCPKTGYKNTADPSKSGVIEQIIPFVKGGTINFNTKLQEMLSRDYKVIDVDDYVSWASSLVDAPVVIKQKSSPIYNLVPVKMKNAYEKKQNLERAIEDYLDEFDECKCKPCQNGGTVTLVDGECLCQCTIHFEGIACQTHKSKLLGENLPVDGKWGCWSAWSACVNNKQSRSRQCINPAPGVGGSQCQGDRVQTADC